MQVLKAALFVVMTVSLGLMWHNRHFVVDAYRIDADGPAEIRLSGVSLDFDKTELAASPYVVHTGIDTRRRPMSLLFTPPEVDPVEMIGGEARIAGAVRIDDEPASGAVVRLERHTTAGTGVRDVLVGANGRFTARNLPGGRYRVRAWLPGAGAMTTSDVFFLEAKGTMTRTYQLEAVDPEPTVQFVNGGTMTVGLTGTFGVIMSRADVDGEGVISTVPVAGMPVAVQFSSHVSSLSPAVVFTDDRGLAQFRMRCLTTGMGRATVTIGHQGLEETTVVALAACVAPPPPTLPIDAVPPPGNQPDPGPSTSTTATGGAGSPPSSNEGGTPSGGGDG